MEIEKILKTLKNSQSNSELQDLIIEFLNYEKNKEFLKNSQLNFFSEISQNSKFDYFKKRLKNIKGAIQRYFAISLDFDKKREIELNLRIKNLQNYFLSEKKKNFFNKKINLFENEKNDNKNLFSQNEMEKDLLQNVMKIKEFANSFKSHLKNDEKNLEILSKNQNENLVKNRDNIDSILDFQKLSQSLGFFKLIKMAFIAVILFFGTIFFIYVDSFIF